MKWAKVSNALNDVSCIMMIGLNDARAIELHLTYIGELNDESGQ